MFLVSILNMILNIPIHRETNLKMEFYSRVICIHRAHIKCSRFPNLSLSIYNGCHIAMEIWRGIGLML